MANADNTTEDTPNLSQDKWPHEPEGMIEFMPDDLSGSPYDMLFNVLTRAQGVVAVLCSEFMGDDDYRPKAPDIVGAQRIHFHPECSYLFVHVYYLIRASRIMATRLVAQALQGESP